MAATKAVIELFEVIKQDSKAVLKVYSQMNLTITRNGYQKKLKKFEKHGLIQKQKIANRHVFVITPKAKLLRSKAITKKNRTDGLGTLIIFDIPEEKHNARDTLRRYLIRSGYTQIRESSFLSPFQMFDDLKDLIEELHLQKNVSVFAAKSEYYFA